MNQHHNSSFQQQHQRDSLTVLSSKGYDVPTSHQHSVFTPDNHQVAHLNRTRDFNSSFHSQHHNETGKLEREQLNETQKTINDFFTEVFSWGADHSGQLGLGASPIGKSYPIPRYCTYNIAIKIISCGDEHSAFITTSNLLYSMGSNQYGQLGIGDQSIRFKNSPILIESLMNKKPISLSSGSTHSVVVCEEGDVYSWGEGKYGALGSLDLSDQYSPQQIRFSDLSRGVQLIQVSCGSKHSSFLDSDGRVYTCGSGEAGQLGLGTRDQENEPVMVRKFLEKAKMVASGQSHTLILSRGGLVFATGANSFGQLGSGNKRGTNIPTLIQDISHIPMRKIAAGSFSASISEVGDLYIWGSGVFGEFLTPHRVKTIHGPTVDISIGYHFGVALNREGQVYSWGHNSNGELGQCDYQERPTPLLVQSLIDRNVTQIACGRNFVVALGQTLKIGDTGQIQRSRSASPLKMDKSFTYGQNMKVDYLNTSTERFSRKQGILQNQSSQSNTKRGKKSARKPSNGITSRGQKSASKKIGGLSSFNEKIERMAPSANKHLKNKTSSQNDSVLKEKKISNLKENYTPLRQSPERSKSKGAVCKHQYHTNQYQTNGEHSLITNRSRSNNRFDDGSNCAKCQHHSHCAGHHHNSPQKNHNISIQSSSKPKTKSKSKTRREYVPQQSQSPFAIEQSQQDQMLITELKIQNQRQQELINELRAQMDQDRTQIRNLKIDKQNADDALWRETGSKKNLENEIIDLRNQLKESMSQNSELKNQNLYLEKCKYEADRMGPLELEYQKQKQMNSDLQADIRRLNENLREQERIYSIKLSDQQSQYQGENRVLMNRIKDLELTLEQKRKEQMTNENALIKYGDSLKELELEFDRREVEMESLRQQNRILQEGIQKEREITINMNQQSLALDEERNRRKNAERELDILRNDIQGLRTQHASEIDSVRRALDDLKYQNEDSLRVINAKNEEIRQLQSDIDTWGEVANKNNKEQSYYKQVISELEEKNRKLNEKLNEVIYNKASAYKQRTLQALRMNTSPDRQEKIEEYGIPNQSDPRLEQILQDEQRPPSFILKTSPSPQKREEPIVTYNVFKELDKIDMSSKSKDISPYRVPDLTGPMDSQALRREDLSNTKNLKPFESSFAFSMYPASIGTSNQVASNHHHQRSGSTNANTYLNQNASPLRSKGQVQGIGNFSSSQTPQKPQGFNSYVQQLPSSQQVSHQELVKSQIEKLANVLGLPNQNQPEINYYQQHKSEAVKEQLGSQTQMTTSMIKKSLHDLRTKLESIKKDKEIVNEGMNEYEQRNFQQN